MTEATARAMIQAHFDASNGGKVVRERIYFGEPWEPPAWPARWVERFDPWERG